MRKYFLPLALALATLYLTLSVSAVSCLFAHESRPGSAHHHTGGVTHSSLCAWACHANPTVDLPATTPQAQPLLLVTLLLLVVAIMPSFLSQQSARSRAPPRQYFTSNWQTWALLAADNSTDPFTQVFLPSLAGRSMST